MWVAEDPWACVAARRVIEAARGAGAEFILVAGDTFEDNGVDRVLVQKEATR